ncbi:aldo-keto reductase family 1 member A1-like [Ptychodera flava]|uniref:aldo-keto reductase family 1 member A1-like n=1 Tax=Ptychodera flava TaxID=63121 RepID=UPI003969DCE6
MKTSVNLFTGAEMPLLGFGTFSWTGEPERVANAVKHALECGYRHIDCASMYGNEKEIGVAVKGVKGMDRRDIFITSKLWNTMHAAEDVRPACEKSMQDLGVDYLDLYLVHWPFGFKNPGDGNLFPKNSDGTLMYSDVSIMETWSAMEKLVDQGLCRHIGVSNFNSKQLAEVLDKGRIKPAVLQIECHPYFNQSKLIKFCQERGIAVTAFSPLACPGRLTLKPGEPVVIEDPVLKDIGGKYNKTAAQVALRFNVQRDVIVIPKSATPARITHNKELFDFALSEEDMRAIEGLHNQDTGRICKPIVTVGDKKILWGAGHPLFPFDEEF